MDLQGNYKSELKHGECKGLWMHKFPNVHLGCSCLAKMLTHSCIRSILHLRHLAHALIHSILRAEQLRVKGLA